MFHKHLIWLAEFLQNGLGEGAADWRGVSREKCGISSGLAAKCVWMLGFEGTVLGAFSGWKSTPWQSPGRSLTLKEGKYCSRSNSPTTTEIRSLQRLSCAFGRWLHGLLQRKLTVPATVGLNDANAKLQSTSFASYRSLHQPKTLREALIRYWSWFHLCPAKWITLHDKLSKILTCSPMILGSLLSCLV